MPPSDSGAVTLTPAEANTAARLDKLLGEHVQTVITTMTTLETEITATKKRIRVCDNILSIDAKRPGITQRLYSETLAQYRRE